jgi:hypothetical protein
VALELTSLKGVAESGDEHAAEHTAEHVDGQKEGSPRLTASQLGLASIYAKANPQRGRPRHRSLPGSLTVSVSKKRLRGSSLGGEWFAKNTD